WDLRQTYRGLRDGIDGLQLRRASTGAAFAIGLTPKLQWTLGGAISYRDYAGAPRSTFFSNGWLAELDNRFDYLLESWPDRRLRVGGFASLRAGHIFTMTPSRLVASDAGLHSTWFPQAKDDKYRVFLRARTGKMFGNAPLDELYMLGMERDNGRDFWLRGIVGTANGRKGNAPLGREYVIAQGDLERRMFEFPFIRAAAGPFFDAGRVTDPSGLFGSRGMLYASGVQAELRTLGAVELTFVYGRDLAAGRGVFYTAVGRRGARRLQSQQ
ncbi:MAG: hypothetical protein JOZ62_00780, partial [Acidobacteriaceae bacterium]|nr:hypothetical protein [Acidobacteriaceae bacterium]